MIRQLLEEPPRTRPFADLLIDCKEDRTLRAVLVGMLREGRRELVRLQAEDVAQGRMPR